MFHPPNCGPTMFTHWQPFYPPVPTFAQTTLSPIIPFPMQFNGINTALHYTSAASPPFQHWHFLCPLLIQSGTCQPVVQLAIAQAPSFQPHFMTTTNATTRQFSNENCILNLVVNDLQQITSQLLYPPQSNAQISGTVTASSTIVTETRIDVSRMITPHGGPPAPLNQSTEWQAKQNGPIDRANASNEGGNTQNSNATLPISPNSITETMAKKQLNDLNDFDCSEGRGGDSSSESEEPRENQSESVTKRSLSNLHQRSESKLVAERDTPPMSKRRKLTLANEAFEQRAIRLKINRENYRVKRNQLSETQLAKRRKQDAQLKRKYRASQSKKERAEKLQLRNKVAREKRQRLRQERETAAALSRFKCDVCNAAFDTKQRQVRHTNEVHLNLRPFRCELCTSKTFKRQENLNWHLQSFHLRANRVACTFPECKSTFDHKQKLSRHIRETHLQLRPFKCKHCQMSFKRQEGLTNHEQAFHKV